MRKYKIVFAKEAKEDLKNIRVYVERVSSVQNANMVTKRIAKKIRSFNVFPERSEIFDENGSGLLLRATISGKYRIIYAVKKQTKEVVIVRIISASQDTKDAI